MSEIRMNAYYYAFEPTGVSAIDRILSAVAAAGTAYHHTEDWCYPGENGFSQVDYIQQSAVDAVASFTAARNAALEEAAKEVDKLQTMALGMVRRHKLYGRDAETLKAAAHVVRALIEKEG